MSLGRHVCCQHLRLNAPKDHIWISEDLLNNALYRFAHGRVPRRNVGLAPGPLESRKRATKRRMMDLAQVGAGWSADPSVLPTLGAPDYKEWKWQSPRPLTPRRADGPEVPPLPSWLTDASPLGADPRLEHVGKEEIIDGIEKYEASEQQSVDLGRTDPLANPMVMKDFKKCMGVDEVYSWAANHGIDVRRHCELLFSHLCYASKPLPLLLQALEDAALGTPGNFRFLLKWQMKRRRSGKRHGRLKPEDMPILQKWMNWQLHLGLKSEEDILAFLKFVSRTSDTMKCNLVASLQGLQSSRVFGFNDLGTTTQNKIIEYVLRAPVTRQMLELGFSLVVAIPNSQYILADAKICAFIRRVVHMYASRREHKKPEIGWSELVPTILETIMGLPKERWHNVVMITTRYLIDDHLHMPAIEAATMQLPSLWLPALAERRSCGPWELEDLLGTQKPEVVVPYLQRLDEREQACFILRHWFGHRSLSGHARAQQIFDEFWPARPKESAWFRMLRAARKYSRESSRPLDAPTRRIFKTLQMLHQSETIIEIVKRYRKIRPIIDETDIVYIIREHLEEQLYIAQRLLHFYPGLRLEMCPELAERMILDPKTHPATALRYMRRLCPPHHVYRYRYTLARPRMELLARMALAYSTAPHISPRLAFKRVYECYTQHMKERLGPLPVATARAFTRAGLIRHLETGQYGEPTTFDWILSVIRSTEGRDVADKVFEIGHRWRGIHLADLEPK